MDEMWLSHSNQGRKSAMTICRPEEFLISWGNLNLTQRSFVANIYMIPNCIRGYDVAFGILERAMQTFFQAYLTILDGKLSLNNLRWRVRGKWRSRLYGRGAQGGVKCRHLTEYVHPATSRRNREYLRHDEDWHSSTQLFHRGIKYNWMCYFFLLLVQRIDNESNCYAILIEKPLSIRSWKMTGCKSALRTCLRNIPTVKCSTVNRWFRRIDWAEHSP